MWKQRLGSYATYQKLINVFESAGYHAYAENVRSIACPDIDGPNDYAEPLPQPETYPQPKSSPPTSSKLSKHRLSSCDEFLLINSADAQDLPEGDIYSQNILESYNVSTVPLLSFKEPEVNKPIDSAATAPSSISESLTQPVDSAAIIAASLPKSESVGNHADINQWFFGQMTSAESRKLLKTRYNQDGSYLIRNSESDPGGFTLCFREGEKVRHVRILRSRNGRLYLQIDKFRYFATLEQLVSHYQYPAAHDLPIKLVYPCIPLHKQQWEIDRRQLKLMMKLQDGEFIDVWQGLLDEKVPVSVKTCKPQLMTQAKSFLQVASLLKDFHHLGFISIFGVCTKKAPFYVITEPVHNHSSLLEYLVIEEKAVRLHEQIDMSKQVAKAMAYLEEQNIIHRDLAARNILVGKNLTCKVANFEMARVINEGSTFEIRNETRHTYKWTAPEAIIKKLYSIKSDVWSFGIVLYEIITCGRPPYPDMTDDEVLKELQYGYRIPQPDECLDELYDIMLDCWQEEPANRPKFKMLQLKFKQLFVAYDHRDEVIFTSISVNQPG